jgi:hypothetical protein
MNCMLEFLSSYATCILVPIELFVSKSYRLGGNVAMILVVLDIITFCCCCTTIYSTKRCLTSTATLLASTSPMLILPVLLSSSIIRNARSDNVLVLVQCIRLVRFAFLQRQFNASMDVLIKMNYRINAVLARIVLISLYAALFTSSMAALWFGLACYHNQHFFSETSASYDSSFYCTLDGTWLELDQASGFASVSDHYLGFLRALHFVAQTMFTVGYGDIHPVSEMELLFSLFLLLSGALFYGYVISAITSLLSSQGIATKQFREELALVRSYLTLRKSGEAVRAQFISYFEFLFTRQLGVDEESVLLSLPEELAGTIRRDCCLAILLSVPFFREHHQQQQQALGSMAGDSFAAMCVHKLKFVTFGPGCVLFAKNSAERVLFLIRMGRIDLLSSSDSSKPVHSIIPGDYLGDFQMIFGVPAMYSAVSCGFSEVAILRYCIVIRTSYGLLFIHLFAYFLAYFLFVIP